MGEMPGRVSGVLSALWEKEKEVSGVASSAMCIAIIFIQR